MIDNGLTDLRRMESNPANGEVAQLVRAESNSEGSQVQVLSSPRHKTAITMKQYSTDQNGGGKTTETHTDQTVREGSAAEQVHEAPVKTTTTTQTTEQSGSDAE